MAMQDSDTTIVLVTPVWMDSKRLGKFGPELAKAIAESGLPVRWIVSDDGSGAEEQGRVEQLVESLQQVYPRVEALLLPERSRKGEAIYCAWNQCPDARWLAFVDADGAVAASSTLDLIRRAMQLGDLGACIAVRQDSAATPVQRTKGRAVSFKLFSFLVRRIVAIQFTDTQCGAKVVPGAVYFKVAKLLHERGFVFDVELLLLLQRFGATIEELPVPWSEVDGSKILPFRDAWGMVAGLLRIRCRSLRNAYPVV
ncbi:MAG: glycosyltransferase [Opitutales bacterium]